MLSVVMLSVIMLNVVMLSVVMLSVVMLNVVMLSVVMLNAVAPAQGLCSKTTHQRLSWGALPTVVIKVTTFYISF
jgi:hypothetical protein